MNHSFENLWNLKLIIDNFGLFCVTFCFLKAYSFIEWHILPIIVSILYIQVFVHNPHSRSLNPDGRWVMSASANDINFLNINQTVNALTAGKLKPLNQINSNNKSNVNNDVLVIGTPTSIMVYDVLNNTDLFYKEVCILCNFKFGSHFI